MTDDGGSTVEERIFFVGTEIKAHPVEMDLQRRSGVDTSLCCKITSHGRSEQCLTVGTSL